MLFDAVAQLKLRSEADLLVLPFWSKQKNAKPSASLETLSSVVQSPIELRDFTGKEGELFLMHVKKMPEKRILLIGLGNEDEISAEKLRRAYAGVVKECLKKKYLNLNILLPNISEIRRLSVESFLEAIAEGLLLPNYQWKHLQADAEPLPLLKQVTLIGILPKLLEVVKKRQAIAEGVHFARDLINGNADRVTPQYLAETAETIAKKFPSIQTTILNKEQIEEEKMGLFLAVARGSMQDPAFIIMNYKGFPKSKDHTIIIGKGVTFDTGGLNLKPTGSMETMRCDMSGAAAAIATIATVASLKLKLNVTIIVAATENAIDRKSFKPGDVYTAFTGKTVEIGNTDAEGRLTLADALGYAVKNLKPTRLIDLATLTGAMVVALGDEMAGLFCNDHQFAKQLLEASERTGELLWRMPLHPEYKEQLKSDIADLKNIGTRAGGSITAALFLEEFVNGIPWAHLDIAGVAFAQKEKYYCPKNGVGFGVRLLIDFLQNL